METKISKQLKRYYENKDKYNERAKNYYNTIYYPKHREEILKKAVEQRKKNINPYIKPHIIYKKSREIYRNESTSLIVSFD